MMNVYKIRVYTFLTLVLFPIPQVFVCFFFPFLWPNFHLWFALRIPVGPSPCWPGSDCCKGSLRIIEILSMWGRAPSPVQVADGCKISPIFLTFLTLPNTQPEVHKTNKSCKYRKKEGTSSCTLSVA